MLKWPVFAGSRKAYMTRNHLGIIAAALVAAFSLLACTLPAPARDGGSGGAMSMAPGHGSEGYQGRAPYGADPDAHFHRLESVGNLP